MGRDVRGTGRHAGPARGRGTSPDRPPRGRPGRRATRAQARGPGTWRRAPRRSGHGPHGPRRGQGRGSGMGRHGAPHGTRQHGARHRARDVAPQARHGAGTGPARRPARCGDGLRRRSRPTARHNAATQPERRTDVAETGARRGTERHGPGTRLTEAQTWRTGRHETAAWPSTSPGREPHGTRTRPNLARDVTPPHGPTCKRHGGRHVARTVRRRGSARERDTSLGTARRRDPRDAGTWPERSRTWHRTGRARDVARSGTDVAHGAGTGAEWPSTSPGRGPHGARHGVADGQRRGPHGQARGRRTRQGLAPRGPCGAGGGVVPAA